MFPEYIEPLFRPPSEARSLILQVTNGCSWNKCTFCEMYTASQKRFRPKPQEQIERELSIIAQSGQAIRRIFLADGDAMTLSYRRLSEILRAINHYLPNVQRISSYCLPRNLKNKSVDQLSELQALGLSLMYVGCETGDDLMLEKIQKGENYESSLSALLKAKQAGMKRSVMILNGLGGKKYSEQHAINSARLMNEAQPEYLSTLVVSFPQGITRYQEGFGGDFEALGQIELAQEMEFLLSHLALEQTIFRSDHASNYLVLKGTLNQDREKLLKIVRMALKQPGSVPLRQEWQRGI
ncbi:MAG: B12-binding domain-containing radical SAM protein [Pseudomonadales bacterium]|nr:B12-binding domain-containing radical SAM protein [Pseudomonadales bacterium]